MGAALIAQAMDRREGAGRYKAMQSIMDWDRSRLAYRAVKRAFKLHCNPEPPGRGHQHYAHHHPALYAGCAVL